MIPDEQTSRADATQPAAPAARLFAVRLWREELAGGSEYRGRVRDLTSDAFVGFRDWMELVAFMVARMEGDGAPPRGRGGEA